MRILVLALLPVSVSAQPTSPKAFVKSFGADQKAIWTSPKHAPENLKWLAPLAVATGALIATDRHSSAALPNTRDQLAVSSHISDAGIGYIAGGPSALLLTGVLTHNRKARDTGLLAAEALAGSDAEECVDALHRAGRIRHEIIVGLEQDPTTRRSALHLDRVAVPVLHH